MTSKNSQKQSFEESLRRLEEIVNQLEQGEIPLEDSVKMYEEGLALSKACIEKLTQAELKLKKLSKDIDGNFQFLEGESK
ncbi:MAG: xseB [Bacteroidetes bacterium]|nr:xseB [Bacteroidota bacterium]